MSIEYCITVDMIPIKVSTLLLLYLRIMINETIPIAAKPLTLKETMNANGAHFFTNGFNIFGVISRLSCNAPSDDWILCSGWKLLEQFTIATKLILALYFIIDSNDGQNG